MPDTGVTGTTANDVCRGWKSVNAIVIGNHEIPQRTAMYIPVSVPNATVVCYLCLEGPSRVNTLAIDFTLNTLREGRRIVVLVVTSTGGPVKLRNDLFGSRSSVRRTDVTQTDGVKTYSCRRRNQPCAGDKTSQSSSLGSFQKVGDYPELKGPLLKLLHRIVTSLSYPVSL